MSECVYEMKMPARYVDLSEDEMEYDGGFWNFFVAAVAVVVSCVATTLATAGVISSTTALAINVVCTVVAVAFTAGALGGVTQALQNGVKIMASAGDNAAQAVYGATKFVGTVYKATSTGANAVSKL